MMPPLVLASTSRYRRELLARLGLPFDSARPDVDETPLPDEAVDGMVVRLAEAKAAAIAGARPEAWVIGADQAAELDGHALGKPGDAERAEAQLAAMAGRAVHFHTAVCLCNGERRLTASDVTTVHLRRLSAAEIRHYVAQERPFDCAGSFKSEGLGISLFDAIETRDPTALIGLPLIATARLLREVGYALP